MKKWIELCSDVNWEDYGGMWARKAPDGSWYVLQWTNLWDAAGEDSGLPQFECDVKRVELFNLPEAEITSAMRCVGLAWVPDGHNGEIMTESGDIVADTEERTALVLVEACVQYGLGAPLQSFSGDKYPKRIRARARRYAEECMRDDALLERQLDRPVNKIGSTAREYGRGDIDSALHRGPFDTGKQIIRKLHGLPPGE